VVSVSLLFCAIAQAANIGADLKRLSLDELLDLKVTTVSREQSTVGQSPAAIHVITQEDIRRSGTTAIPELLRRVPGVNVARVDTNKWAISARGFNDRFANKLLVQMDGRTVYSPIFSGVFWDTMDYVLADIDRIEVVRGPGASVWGANAVNGVINILTKSAADTQGGLVNGGGGTEEQGFGEIRYGSTLGDETYYRLYAKGFDRDESFSVNSAPVDQWHGGRAGFRADWPSAGPNEVTLQGDYFHSNAERIDFRPQPTSPFVYTNAEHEISDGANILARWTQTISSDSSWTLQAYWDHIKRQSTGDILMFRMDVLDIDFQHRFALGGRHDIVWGLGYRATDTALTDSRFNGFILSWDPHHRRLSSPSAFVQDQITIMEDKFSVTIGTKLEHNDLTGVEVQPTLRALWTPGADQTVWAAVSRAVRIPTLFEDQRSVTQTPVFPAAGVTIFPRIVANPDLESEELLAYELGYRVQASATFSLDAAAFYNVYDELKVFATQGTTTNGAPAGTRFQLLTHRNLMRGQTHGLELGAHWKPMDWWRLNAAYSVLRMSLHADAGLPATNRVTAESAERQSPEQQVYLQSSWSLPRNVEFDLIGRFVDRLTGFQQPVESYTSMDLRFGWRARDGLMLEIVGQNLLDDHHLEVGGSILAGPLHELQRGVYARAVVAW
jgi:iron complex outermembrane receptor protein